MPDKNRKFPGLVRPSSQDCIEATAWVRLCAALTTIGMSIFSRHSSILRPMTMLCMALSVVLSSQGYIKLTDHAQHAIHQEHAPNPLAGAVKQCEHSHDHHGKHRHCDEGHASDTGAAHQHLDSSIVYIVTAVPDISASRQSSFVSVTVPQELDRLYAYRLERPPKTALASYA